MLYIRELSSVRTGSTEKSMASFRILVGMVPQYLSALLLIFPVTQGATYGPQESNEQPGSLALNHISNLLEMYCIYWQGPPSNLVSATLSNGPQTLWEFLLGRGKWCHAIPWFAPLSSGTRVCFCLRLSNWKWVVIIICTVFKIWGAWQRLMSDTPNFWESAATSGKWRQAPASLQSSIIQGITFLNFSPPSPLRGRGQDPHDAPIWKLLLYEMLGISVMNWSCVFLPFNWEPRIMNVQFCKGDVNIPTSLGFQYLSLVITISVFVFGGCKMF